MLNENILAKRYATSEIKDLFSETGKITFFRELWISVMKAQREQGLDIPEEAIKQFEEHKKDINLDDIKKREARTKHDVKANIESFVAAAGAGEHIHKGMTSRDLTDNVEQMQNKKALHIIFKKGIAILAQLLQKAKEYEHIILTARTHHQPAQATALGRRYAMWAEELFLHLKEIEQFLASYPLRGIKGPVGTQLDMQSLLGTRERVEHFEKSIASQLGFDKLLSAPGQVYPRSLDFSLLSKLVGFASALENTAQTMRLMAGYDLLTEGFKEGQVGSSAMPHKMNTRSTERIQGFATILKGYLTMGSVLSGGQWEEGDVSCSVVRRVCLADAFFAADGMCETMLTVLADMGVYEKVVEQEVEKYFPFLATTQFLLLAVEKGAGREEAHSVVKKHALQAARDLREGKAPQLIENLSEDPLFKEKGITKQELNEKVKDKKVFIGRAQEQITQVEQECEEFLSRYKEEASYTPKEIL